MKTLADGSLYLSRLILDPRCRRVWSELAEPYEMHRTLMRAFPQAADPTKQKARDEFGVLFRADVDERRHRVILYVQSCVEPDWSFLDSVADYLLEDVDPPKDVGKACRRLQKGQMLSFRLRANPTRRVWNAKPDTTAVRGQRVALCTEKEQIEWLVRKSNERIGENGTKETAGFELAMMDLKGGDGQVKYVPQVSVRPEGMQMGHKANENGSHDMTHLAVVFEGILTVTDPVAFRQTLACGIGPAKAFGFGLLSVAPIQGQ